MESVTQKCNVKGCKRAHASKGWCITHYMYVRRTGSMPTNPLPEKPRITNRLGLRNHYLYQVWSTMKQRCYNPKCKDYAYYGGRGIKVSPQWVNSFRQFLNDMGDRPSSAHSIDRINNDGNYEPSNCRWATMQEQARNKRRYK